MPYGILGVPGGLQWRGSDVRLESDLGQVAGGFTRQRLGALPWGASLSEAFQNESLSCPPWWVAHRGCLAQLADWLIKALVKISPQHQTVYQSHFCYGLALPQQRKLSFCPTFPQAGTSLFLAADGTPGSRMCWAKDFCQAPWASYEIWDSGRAHFLTEAQIPSIALKPALPLHHSPEGWAAKSGKIRPPELPSLEGVGQGPGLQEPRGPPHPWEVNSPNMWPQAALITRGPAHGHKLSDLFCYLELLNK